MNITNRQNSHRGAATINILGAVMFFGALAVIVMCRINCWANNNQANEHPFVTLFSGGANLSKAAYTFLPPWTGFEVIVLITGVVGFILFRIKAGSSDDKKGSD